MCKKYKLEYDSLVDKNNLKSIMKVFKKYSFESISKSIFALNAYLPNRNLLDLMITTNYAFHLMEEEGKQKILTYENFCDFVGEIEKSYTHNPMNTDIQVHDLGEIHYSFLGKNYPIVIGTGHDHSYTFHLFIEQIANITENSDSFINLFEYSSYLITKISSFTSDRATKFDQNISCPKESYFERIFIEYQKFCDKFKFYNISDVLQDIHHSNKIHYTNKKGTSFVLYNTSIIIDFATFVLSNLSDEDNKSIVSSTIKQRLLNQYELSSEQEHIFYNPLVFEDPKEKPVYTPIAIIIYDANIYIVSDADDMTNGVRKEIVKLQTTNKLFLGTIMGEKYKVVNVPKSVNLKFINIINHINISEPHSSFIEYSNDFEVLALDFVYFIIRSNSFIDVEKFIFNHQNSEQSFFGTEGLSGLFEVSLKTEGMLELGALTFSMYATDLYTPGNKIYDLYSDEYKNIPFLMNDSLFSNPFEWIIHDYSYGFDYVKRKGTDLIGYVRSEKNFQYIFVCRNTSHVSQDNITTSFFNHMKSLDDLLVFMFNRFWTDLIDLKILNIGIQLFIIPFEKEQSYQVGKYGFKGKYLNGDTQFIESPRNVRITVNEDKLFKDISKALTREVEIRFFIELLTSMIEDQTVLKQIIEIVNKDSGKEKITNSMEIQIPFYKNMNNISYWAKDRDFILVRKRIAKICKEVGVEPELYSLDDAKNVIRKLQKHLHQDLVTLIRQTNALLLHKELVMLHASIQFDIFMARKKIYANSKGVLDELNQKYKEDNISIREDSKNKLRYVRYLIENNLKFGDYDSKENAIFDIKFLLAYADWLVVLQDNSDMFHWKIDSCKIEITFDYRVDTVFEKSIKSEHENLMNRVYNSVTYLSDNIPFINENNELLDAFKIDLGFDFIDFVKLLGLLSDNGDDRVGHEVQLDVVRYDYIELKNIINKEYPDWTEDYLKLMLDYISIDTDNLNKTYKEHNLIDHDYIPIWEREYRPNRYELKPLLHKENSYVFSPYTCYETMSLWTNNLSSLYPVHEHNLTEVLKVVRSQQAIVQKDMVTDIYNLFLRKGMEYSHKEFKLHKHGSHPEYLGDYDVFVFDVSNNIVWNIESKVLQHVGSVSEYAKHQNTFYFTHESDVKFQRRINYIEENISTICNDMSITFSGEIQFKHLMVTNKVFISQFKDITFKIITYHEIKQLLLKY